MKKIILVAALPFAFMACKNGGTDAAKEARAQQMTIDSLKTEMVKQQIIDSMNRVATIPVNNVPLNNENQSVAMPVASPVANVSQPTSTHSTARHKSSTRHEHHNSYNGYNDNAYAGNYDHAPSNYNSGSNYNDYQQPVQQKTRRGWNNKLKGGVIGVGAGAITGALVDHNKGRGAILGGLLGGGAGLGIGALLDRRQGN